MAAKYFRVTAERGLNIRLGPGRERQDVGNLPPGALVEVLEGAVGEYAPIRLWAALRYLEEVSAPQEPPEGLEEGIKEEGEGVSIPGAMKTSPRGLEFIKNEEGCILHVYHDPAGYPTIGVGHLIKEGEEFDIITEDKALELLAQDVRIAEETINRLVEVPLSQNQFDALASFIFNVGTGNFLRSTLLKVLNQGQYDAVPGELAKWRKAGGKVLPGLVARRQREGELWGAAAVQIPQKLAAGIPAVILQADLAEIFASPADGHPSEVWDEWSEKWLAWIDLSPWTDQLLQVSGLREENRIGFWGNKVLREPIRKVFGLLAERGLLQEIQTFNGCWCVRPMKGGSRPSVHSWALALDFNALTNPFGGGCTWSDEFLETWAECGWECGAIWDNPDAMHFQWAWVRDWREYEPEPLIPKAEGRV